MKQLLGNFLIYGMETLIQTSDIYRKCDFEDGFRDGAEWRIESVWHKPNEEPLVKSSLLFIEHIDGEFEL